MHGLVDVIHRLEDHFEALGIRRSYGGAIAYNFFGPPRFTQDIDVLVLASDLKIPGLVEALAAEGCHPAGQPEKRLDPRSVLDDLRSKAHLTSFLFRGVRVEFFVPWHPFHHRVLERSPERDLDGRLIRIHAAEDLIVFKKIFNRPKDIMDIKALLLARKGLLDIERIQSDSRDMLSDEGCNELQALITRYSEA